MAAAAAVENVQQDTTEAAGCSGSGRRYLPFFAHLEKETTTDDADDEDEITEDEDE